MNEATAAFEAAVPRGPERGSGQRDQAGERQARTTLGIRRVARSRVSLISRIRPYILGLTFVAFAMAASTAQALDPVDPAASREARELLDYLSELPNQSGKRVISGQTIHGDLASQYNRYVKGYKNKTGEYPGILQLTLSDDSLPERSAPSTHRSDATVFPLSYNHANRGGHVIWIYQPGNPFNGESSTTLIPAGHALSEVYTVGAAANRMWSEDLQMLAIQAARMGEAGIPVTICMFGGYNSSEQRWQNVRSNAGASWEDFRAAWRYGVQALRDEGANNLLWCLEEANGSATYRLLGWQEDWVDIQAMRASHDNESAGPLALYQAYLANSGKPIIYGQFRLKSALSSSPPSYLYDRAIELVRDSMPRVSAIVPWSTSESASKESREHSPVFHLKSDVYTDDPWMANRGELAADFGDSRRAKLPTDRTAIAMSGRYAENFDDESPRWVPSANGGIQNSAASDGILDLFFFGDDPILKRTGRNMGAEYNNLRVRLRNNSLADRVELSWRRTTDDDWSDERRVTIPVRQMGLYLEEYSIDLSGHPQWTDTVRELRLHLNPDHRFGSAEVDYIKFDKTGGVPATSLSNPGFEKSLGVGWQVEDKAQPTMLTAREGSDVRSGEQALLLFLRDDSNDGISQDITSIIEQGGPGNYRFGARFKLPSTAGANRKADVRALISLKVDGNKTYYKVSGLANRNEWTDVGGVANLQWSGELQEASLIFRSAGTTEDLLLDDAYFAFTNLPPELAPVGDRTVEAGTTLRIDVTASDDGPPPLILEASPLPGTASFTDEGDGSGVFEWTPDEGDVSATPYAVTFTATEDGGAGLSSSETIEITVTEPPYAGSMTVDASDPGVVTHDLTSVSTTDWKHFGRTSKSSVNRKAGVPDVIGGYTTIGSPSVVQYNGNPAVRQAVAWSDGTPTASEPGTPSGLYFQGAGGGYSLSLPADTRERTARIYLGGFDALATLELTMSDDSAAPFSLEIDGAGGPFDRVITVTYTAGADGETLDLRYINSRANGSNLSLSSVALSGSVDLPYADDFDSGTDAGWSLAVDDTDSAVSWSIAGGAMRQSVRVAYGSSFEESYHVGTYRYLVDGESLSDYRARVTITPEDATVIDDIGLMFRYRGPDDYYRISQSARHGYTRLEKRENGVYFTLGVTAIGYELGQPTTYEVEVVGADLFVTIDGKRIFAARDSTHGSGSIALYTQDAAYFDNIVVEEAATAPQIAIRRPLDQSVIPGDDLRVEAVALNAPAGGRVVIEVDGYAPRTFSSPPYVVNLSNVPAGEYGVTARLLNAPNGNAVSVHTIGEVAVGGAYVIAVGDSNTNGLRDSYVADNLLVSRIRGAQGYAGTLTDRLDTMSPFFNVVFNEGISGDTAEELRYQRLGSIEERNPDAIRALVGIGTNDVSAGRDSGELCGANDTACLEDTIRGDIQAIVDELVAAGAEVWTATLPPAWTDSTPTPTSPRISATREVNRAIRNGISGDRAGPDLFDQFYSDTDGNGVPDVRRFSLFSDNFHPNGLGHHIIALLWYNALVGDAAGASIAPFLLSEPSVADYKQNFMDPGDEYLVDDFATLTSFPAVLDNGIWVMPKQSDVNRTSPTFLSFSVADRPVDVYVAYDNAATALPNWLNPATTPFSLVPGAQVVTSEGSYKLYRRSYTAGQQITLGGNSASGAAGAGLVYLPIVVDPAAP